MSLLEHRLGRKGLCTFWREECEPLWTWSTYAASRLVDEASRHAGYGNGWRLLRHAACTEEIKHAVKILLWHVFLTGVEEHMGLCHQKNKSLHVKREHHSFSSTVPLCAGFIDPNDPDSDTKFLAPEKLRGLVS